MDHSKEHEKLRQLVVEALDDDEFELQDSEDSYRPSDSTSSESEEDLLRLLMRKKKCGKPQKVVTNVTQPQDIMETSDCFQLPSTSTSTNTRLLLSNDTSSQIPEKLEEPINDCSVPVLQEYFGPNGNNVQENGANDANNSRPRAVNLEQNGDDAENIPPSTEQGRAKSNVKRKKRDVTSWKSYKRSKCHQAGESYVSVAGKEVPAKQITDFKNCVTDCKFKCGVKVNKRERESLFQCFYKMSQNEKYHFLLNTTTKGLTERPKDKTRKTYKQYSFKYFFNIGSDKIQVCKKFYLGTLSISQKPVYTVHKNKDVETNTPKQDGRGKSSGNSRRLSEEKKEAVKEHIRSFPAIESHYCRSSTKKQYLDSNLNLVKMYNLYKQQCPDNPVKLSMYRHIFVSEFNLDFHTRKSDRCDLCEEFIMAESQKLVSDDLKSTYEMHVREKNAMRENRKTDRESTNVPVLCFDLQNVIACPRAEISSFFYKRKLNTYNLTAHFSESKTIYCALWTEAISGRSGNDLASALYKILGKVADEHEFTEIILWSDSCVPQNRNSFISCAVQNFLHEHPHITRVTMKYSVPGHSCIQEVDNAHSMIEKTMSQNEFYSPLGLIRILKTINRKSPVRVLQMKEDDFFDFGGAAKSLNFKQVPFFKVCTIEFNQTLHEVKFKTSFNEEEQSVNLRFMETPARKKSTKKSTSPSLPIWKIISPSKLKCKPTLPSDKVKDIKDMFKFMPVQDREFYTVVLKL